MNAEHAIAGRGRSGRTAVAGLLALALVTMTGCAFARGGGGGALTVRSQGDEPVRLERRFETAAFIVDDAETSIYLTDIPLDELRRGDAVDGVVIHIAVLWRPKPGRTPLTDAAINASVRYVVLSGGEVGVYGGGGFVRPQGRLADDRFAGGIRDGTLRLFEHSAGFNDVLGVAVLEGGFNAERDDRVARAIGLATSQIVTNRLERSLFVRGAESDQAEIEAILTLR